MERRRGKVLPARQTQRAGPWRGAPRQVARGCFCRGERSFRKLNGASQGAGSAAFAAGAVIKSAFFRLLRELLLKFEGKKKRASEEEWDETRQSAGSL